MASTPKDSGDYEVGYGKPPRHTRFKSGHSGNPNGKPKGVKSIKALLGKEGRQRVRITENGKTVSVTKLELAVKRLYERCAKGDLRAIIELTRLLQMYGLDDETVRATLLSAEEQAIIDAAKARMAKVEAFADKAKKRKPRDREGNRPAKGAGDA